MPDQDPPGTLTRLPVPKPGQYPRRARALLPGTRANTLPPVIPAQKIFRISPDSPVGRATVRRWARRNGYDVKVHGKIPKAAVDAFMEKHGIWTVYVRRSLIPGAKNPIEFFQVKQGEFLRALEHGKAETIDPDKVRRVMGNELFAMLKQVKT